jgi:hypothetical protein
MWPLDIILEVVKYKKLNKKNAYIFTCHVIFVIQGFREGYLVDCAYITAEEAKQYITIIHQLSNTEYQVPLLIISVRDDIIIVRRDVYERRLNEIQSPNWNLTYKRVLIDLRNGVPQEMDEKNTTSVLRSMYESCKLTTVIKDENSLVAIHGVSPSSCTCVAGWLLDYPCIYVTIEDGLGAITLQMTELKNFYIGINMLPKLVHASKGFISELDILQCTVPTSCFDSNPNLEYMLSDAFDEKIHDIKMKINKWSQQHQESVVDVNVSVDQTIHSKVDVIVHATLAM